MYISLYFILLYSAIARVHWVHAMNTETAPGGRRPLHQANRLEPQARLYRQPVNCIHRRHLLSLLSPKADTHFTVPRRVEGTHLVTDLPGRRRLHSASSLAVAVPSTRLRTIIRDRAFPAAASQTWNSLPREVTSLTTLSTFKSKLFFSL